MKDKVVKISLWILLVTEGLILTFGLPPFQKFDEVVHWQRAVTVARGNLFCVNRQIQVPKVITDIHQNYNFSGVLEGNQKFDPSLLDWNKRWSQADLAQTATYNRCELNFLGYLPNALGIALASPTRNPLLIFYAGRIFGFLFFLGMFWLTLKNTASKFHPVLWFYALLPMVVHQATAISYDVVILSLIVPLTSLLLKKIDRKEWSHKERWLIWGAITVLGIIKYVYLPLIFIFIVLEWKMSRRFIVRNAAYFGLMLMAVAVMFLGGKGEMYYPNFINPRLQLALILADPLYFLGVLGRTLQEKWWLHITEMVGVMGWKNVPLNTSLVLVIITGAIVWISGRLAKVIKPVGGWKMGVSLAVLAGIVGITTVIMYLVWSVPGSRVVEGIQGRYWLPLVPFTIIFGTMAAKAISSNFGLKLIAVGLVVTLGLNSIWTTLDNRFWDWSYDWKNSEILRQEPVLEGALNDPVSVVGESGQFLISTEGRRVSSVALELRNGSKSIVVPYKYEVRDGECREVLRSGYLDPWQIQYNRQSVIKFEPVEVKTGKLCLTLTPLPWNQPGFQDRLTIRDAGDGGDIVWLYY